MAFAFWPGQRREMRPVHSMWPMRHMISGAILVRKFILCRMAEVAATVATTSVVWQPRPRMPCTLLAETRVMLPMEWLRMGQAMRQVRHVGWEVREGRRIMGRHSSFVRFVKGRPWVALLLSRDMASLTTKATMLRRRELGEIRQLLAKPLSSRMWLAVHVAWVMLIKICRFIRSVIRRGQMPHLPHAQQHYGRKDLHHGCKQ